MMSCRGNVRKITIFLTILLAQALFLGCYFYFKRSENQANHSCLKGSGCETKAHGANFRQKTFPLKPSKLDAYLERVHILPIATQNSSGHNKPKKFDTTQHLIIMSYLKSGSKFFGEIFNQHPLFFYFNEPLSIFDLSTRKDDTEPLSRVIIPKVQDYLLSFLNCYITEVDDIPSSSYLWENRFVKNADLACAEKKVKASLCFSTACKKKKIFATRTVRVYLQDLVPLFYKYKENVKVIIYQRDPRTVLYLRRQQNLGPKLMTHRDFFFRGRDLCSRMLYDVQVAQRLAVQKNSDFFRIVLHEHFISHPEQVLSNLFAFLNVTIRTKEIRRLLKSTALQSLIMNASPYWKYNEDPAIFSIDKGCRFFYKHSFYRAAGSVTDIASQNALCRYCS